jgi:hypothetical protein
MSVDVMASALADMGIMGIGSRVTRVFDYMQIAEEEIQSAMERHEDAVLELNGSFMDLYPGPLLLGLAESVYRAHCRQILESIAAGTGRPLATWAEMCAVLSDLGLNTRLGRIADIAYHIAFSRVCPDEYKSIGNEDFPWSEYEQGEAEKLLGELAIKIDREESKESKGVERKEIPAPIQPLQPLQPIPAPQEDQPTMPIQCDRWPPPFTSRCPNPAVYRLTRTHPIEGIQYLGGPVCAECAVAILDEPENERIAAGGPWDVEAIDPGDYHEEESAECFYCHTTGTLQIGDSLGNRYCSVGCRDGQREYG